MAKGQNVAGKGCGEGMGESGRRKQNGNKEWEREWGRGKEVVWHKGEGRGAR